MSWVLQLLLGIFCIYGLICIFYFFYQERIIFIRYNFLPTATPLKRVHDAVFIATKDGEKIHSLHFKVPYAKKVLLYFHGNTGNLKRWGPVAEELTAYGCDVFVPDYRSYGLSTGKISEKKLFEDARLCYEYLRERYAPEQIVIYGRSLGSAMAVQLASEVKANCLVLETPFANLLEIAKHYAVWLPYQLLLRYKFRSDLYIQSVHYPVYILHGQKDRIVPYRSGKRLFDCIPHVQKEFISFPKGRHNNLSTFPLYAETMKKILGEI